MMKKIKIPVLSKTDKLSDKIAMLTCYLQRFFSLTKTEFFTKINRNRLKSTHFQTCQPVNIRTKIMTQYNFYILKLLIVPHFVQQHVKNITQIVLYLYH